MTLHPPRHRLPHAAPGQVIGLLGGSFDPAHEGHAHITREALRRFRLDRVWWLMSPGNPLKARGPAGIERRMAHARAVMQHPRVTVTDVEALIGTRYTAQTLAVLRRLYPRTRFVWLMGADNLAQFDRWQDWRQIVHSVPIGVLARPGQRMSARVAKCARVYDWARLPPSQSALLPRVAPPVWCFVNVPLRAVSSSDIRARGDWSQQSHPAGHAPDLSAPQPER